MLALLILILFILMLILMLLNLKTGYADTDADLCIRIMSLCCTKGISLVLWQQIEWGSTLSGQLSFLVIDFLLPATTHAEHELFHKWSG